MMTGVRIVDEFREGQPLSCPPVFVLQRDGQGKTADGIAVQSEHMLQVFVNEVHTMALSCSADHLAELVLGRLYSEGLIKTLEEVGSLLVSKDGHRVDVRLVGRTADFSKGECVDVSTACTDNRTLNRYFDSGSPLPILEPQPWDSAWVFSMADTFAKGSPMYSSSHGAHSCMLAKEGAVLYWCEDIGRHNALDKVIGCALLDGVDLSMCQMYSSGRLPLDMVSKAIRARIPLLASKAVPSAEAIELAKRHNLVLICAARPDQMLVYSDPVGCA